MFARLLAAVFLFCTGLVMMAPHYVATITGINLAPEGDFDPLIKFVGFLMFLGGIERIAGLGSKNSDQS